MQARELAMVAVIVWLLLDRRRPRREGFSAPAWMPEGSRYLMTMDDNNHLHALSLEHFLSVVQATAETRARESVPGVREWTVEADAQIAQHCQGL